jgi:predicted TIM-barrel fold metal-dependent hydrolase
MTWRRFMAASSAFYSSAAAQTNTVRGVSGPFRVIDVHHRDRFWLFVNHSNALRETFLEDAERDFDQGVGWKYMPIFYGFLADNAGFWPAYELCACRKCPVIVDLSNWHIGQYALNNEVLERQSAVKSFADYARLLDPIFSHFPSLPICLAHLGTPKNEHHEEAVLDLVKRHPNAFIDTSPNMVRPPAHYRKILTAVGSRKLMWELISHSQT